MTKLNFKRFITILKSIDNLGFNFRNLILILIYDKIVTYEMFKLKESVKRQWLYYDNRLIKLWMVIGLSVPRKKR